MADAVNYKKSKSGYYAVTLLRPFPHEGFLYKPSHDSVTVNEDILQAMIAEGVVESVSPAA